MSSKSKDVSGWTLSNMRKLVDAQNLEVTLKCGAKLAWDDDDGSIRIKFTNPYGLQVNECFGDLPDSVKLATLCIDDEEDFTMVAEFLLQVREAFQVREASVDNLERSEED